MALRFLISSLVPGGLIVESLVEEGDTLTFVAHAPALASPPGASDSRRIHSRHLRLECPGFLGP